MTKYEIDNIEIVKKVDTYSEFFQKKFFNCFKNNMLKKKYVRKTLRHFVTERPLSRNC